MSGARSTEELVARLTDGLEPVRPVAPLHRQLLAVVGVWAVSAAVVAGWLGLHPLAVLERGAISTAFAVVLALVGGGGLTLGLASRIPGRERLALAAAGALAFGALVVLAIGLVLHGSAEAGTLGPRTTCIGRSLVLAIPSALLALALAARSAPWRPGVAGLGLALGATSLAALLVHLSCPSPSPWHWLIAHALVPLAAGAASGLVLAAVLERLGRRPRLAEPGALDA